MEEMSKHGHIARAAMNADMDRKTARKYLAAAALPSELARPRSWRTRTDPFDTRWPEVEAKLREAPDLEAKTLLEWLQEQYPGEHDDGQLRTLQRRVRRWRAAHSPEQEVVFGQQHRPGEAAQTDFTWTTELGVTIAGELFVHMLCVMVLPYSNWQWATVCLSEYLRILHLAASTMEADVGAAIVQLETEGHSITIDAIKALTATVPTTIDVPMLASVAIDLGSYDALIEAAA
jgi:hypothetical protein